MEKPNLTSLFCLFGKKHTIDFVIEDCVYLIGVVARWWCWCVDVWDGSSVSSRCRPAYCCSSFSAFQCPHLSLFLYGVKRELEPCRSWRCGGPRRRYCWLGKIPGRLPSPPSARVLPARTAKPADMSRTDPVVLVFVESYIPSWVRTSWPSWNLGDFDTRPRSHLGRVICPPSQTRTGVDLHLSSMRTSLSMSTWMPGIESCWTSTVWSMALASSAFSRWAICVVQLDLSQQLVSLMAVNVS